MNTYKDFKTGKIKRTRGTFSGWTLPQGPLRARYAVFKNPKGEVIVPEYCLTKETRANIATLEDLRKVFVPVIMRKHHDDR
jgi:tetraacyldisaccharide-1-P 4'-kinase